MNTWGAAILGGLGHSLEQQGKRWEDQAAEERKQRELEALAIKERNLARFQSELRMDEAAQQQEFDLARDEAQSALVEGREEAQHLRSTGKDLLKTGLERKERSVAGQTEDGLPVTADKYGNFFVNGEPYTGRVYSAKDGKESDFDKKWALAERLDIPVEERKQLLGIDPPGSQILGTPMLNEAAGTVTTVDKRTHQVREQYTPSGARSRAEEMVDEYEDETDKKLSKSERRVMEDEFTRRLLEQQSGGKPSPSILSGIPETGGAQKQPPSAQNERPKVEAQGQRAPAAAVEALRRIEAMKGKDGYDPTLKAQFKAKYGYLPEGI